MGSLILVLFSFCGICAKYFSADRDEGKRMRFAHLLNAPPAQKNVAERHLNC